MRRRGVAIDYTALPSSLKRAKARNGLRGIWLKIQRLICSPALLHGMPDGIVYLAEVIYETDSAMAMTAIRSGDPAFFVAILMRLDQIDTALLAAGRNIADRGPVIYARSVVDGFKKVAEENFTKRGGLTST